MRKKILDLNIEELLKMFFLDKEVFDRSQWEMSSSPQKTHFNDKTYLSPFLVTDSKQYFGGYCHLDFHYMNPRDGYKMSLYYFDQFGEVKIEQHANISDLSDELREFIEYVFDLV